MHLFVISVRDVHKLNANFSKIIYRMKTSLKDVINYFCVTIVELLNPETQDGDTESAEVKIAKVTFCYNKSSKENVKYKKYLKNQIKPKYQITIGTLF